MRDTTEFNLDDRRTAPVKNGRAREANFSCVDCGGELSHLFGETFGCAYCGQQYRVTVEAKV